LAAQGDPIVSFAQAFLGKVVHMSESNVGTKEADSLNRGFTLIELMIAVAIVAIVAMIAIPSYTAQMVKGRRSSAEAVLMDIAQREQQYLLDVRGYAYSAATLNTTIPVDVSTYYTITFPNPVAGPPNFTAVATPIAGTAQAGDVVLKIDNTGAKTPANLW
jgi:type IV pilus assembly protein PilE